jgi:iron complex outermembrane recepter protein
MKSIAYGALAIALATTGGVAQAQETEISEIIVTAQKRQERLSDVPISISAATGDQLDQAGVRGVADLEKIVPSFTFTQSNYGSPVFTIRGVGLYDTAVGVAPTVTVYSDQIPVPFLAMSKGVSLDVERVEVLKGPQGTLFGQNSTGGAINYIAAKPGANTEAGFDLTYSRFAAVEARGFVSLPLGENLGARLAVRHEMSDGWQQSVSRPQDTLGERDFSQARLILDWSPSDTVTAELVAEAWRDQSDNQAGQFRGYIPARPNVANVVAALGSLPLAPLDPRAADWDAGSEFARDEWFYRLSAQFGLDVSDAFAINSITSYARYSADGFADADGTDFAEYYANSVAEVKSFFQELRGEVVLDRFNLTLGVNYQSDIVDENRAFPRWDASSGVFGPFRFRAFDAVSDQKSYTYSAFAGGDYEILPDLRVEGGIRYSKQNRDYAGCLFDVDGQLARIAAAVGGAGLPQPPQGQGQCVSLIQTSTGFRQAPIITDTLDESNVSWRGGINYKPSNRSLIYASISRGYKAGTFTPLPALFAVQLQPATQESVISYEAGFRASAPGGWASVSASAFRYDYSDKQILGTTVIAGLNIPVPQLVNVPTSRVNGAEVDLTLQPVSGLTMRGGLAYVDTKVTGSFITSSQLGAAIDINGQAFPLTPKWRLSGGVTYEFPVGDQLSASVGANANYRSGTVATFGTPAETENAIDGYTLVGLRAGIGAPDDSWRVEIWGENIFNTYYWNNVVRSPDTVSRMAGMPATYGITLRTRFD